MGATDPTKKRDGMRFFFILTLSSFAMTGCRPAALSDDYRPDMDHILIPLRILASDSLEGREAGTVGEDMAARYLAAQLRQYGIQPFAYPAGIAAHDSLTFLQPFDAVKVTVLASSGMTLVDSGDLRNAYFWFGEHMVNFHQYVFDTDFDGPVVFAGYGITAPEFGYDDYEGLDVRGKIVLALDGEPCSDRDDFFFADIPSSYSSALYYKRHRAKELGARALVVLAYDKLLEKWGEYRTYFKSGKLVFKDDLAGFSDSTSLPFFYANEFFFRRVLASSPFSFDSIRSMAGAGNTVPRFGLAGKRITGQMRTKRVATKSQNVVGVIPGRDSVLKNEYVVLGAHFDHLGISEAGDVFNGADDNASGTVAVLETARGLAGRTDLRRSILIIFHGGEEKGLLGSEYYTSESTLRPVELSQMVCHLNMDMVGRESEDSIHVIGSGRLSSELKSLNESINRRLGLFHFDYTFDADDDPNRYYYRSDHYHYARNGIPVVFFFDGMTEDYHKPTDDVEKINPSKIAKAARLLYHLARSIANLDHRLRLDADPPTH